MYIGVYVYTYIHIYIFIYIHTFFIHELHVLWGAKPLSAPKKSRFGVYTYMQWIHTRIFMIIVGMQWGLWIENYQPASTTRSCCLRTKDRALLELKCYEIWRGKTLVYPGFRQAQKMVTSVGHYIYVGQVSLK